MTLTTTSPDSLGKPGLGWRILTALPVIGTLAKDIQRDINSVFYLLVILLTLMVLAVKTWGLVAIGLTGVAAVPVMFVLLISITQG